MIFNHLHLLEAHYSFALGALHSFRCLLISLLSLCILIFLLLQNIPPKSAIGHFIFHLHKFSSGKLIQPHSFKNTSPPGALRIPLSNSDLSPISIPLHFLFAGLCHPAFPLYPQSKVFKKQLIFSLKPTGHMVFCSIPSSTGALSYNIISDSYTRPQLSNRDLTLLIRPPRCLQFGLLSSPTASLEIMLHFK